MQFLPSTWGGHTWKTPAQTSFAHARHTMCGVSSPVRTGLYPSGLSTHHSHSQCHGSFPDQAREGTTGMRTTAPELTNAVHMKISNPTEVAEARHLHLCQAPLPSPRSQCLPALPDSSLRLQRPNSSCGPGPLITMALLNLPPPLVRAVLSRHQRDFLLPLGS